MIGRISYEKKKTIKSLTKNVDDLKIASANIMTIYDKVNAINIDETPGNWMGEFSKYALGTIPDYLRNVGSSFVFSIEQKMLKNSRVQEIYYGIDRKVKYVRIINNNTNSIYMDWRREYINELIVPNSSTSNIMTVAQMVNKFRPKYNCIFKLNYPDKILDLPTPLKRTSNAIYVSIKNDLYPITIVELNLVFGLPHSLFDEEYYNIYRRKLSGVNWMDNEWYVSNLKGTPVV